MSVIGLFSPKGGVGKTAAAVNLSYLAAEGGGNVLLWDMDPQGASTFYLSGRVGGSVSLKKLLKGASALDYVEDTPYPRLHLLPSRFANRKMDVMLDRVRKPGKRFSRIFKPIRKEFTWVFLDCPSNMSLVSESMFRVVDFILVPIVPTTLSLRTYESLIAFFLSKKLENKLIVPFFSMVEKRKKMHREIMEMLRARDGRILASPVPFLSDIEKMGHYKKPLPAFRRSSPAVEAYRNLWKECRTL